MHNTGPNKDLLYDTGNSTQHPVTSYMGKESKKSTYVYIDSCIYTFLYTQNEYNIVNQLLKRKGYYYHLQ